MKLKLHASQRGEKPSGPGALVLFEFENITSISFTEISGKELVCSLRQFPTSFRTAECPSEFADSDGKKPALNALSISSGSVSITPS